MHNTFSKYIPTTVHAVKKMNVAIKPVKILPKVGRFENPIES